MRVVGGCVWWSLLDRVWLLEPCPFRRGGAIVGALARGLSEKHREDTGHGARGGLMLLRSTVRSRRR